MTARPPRCFALARAALTALAVAAATAGGPPRAWGQETLLQRHYDPEGKTRIEVIGVFSSSLPRGYLPVRVTLRNGTLIDRRWDLSFRFAGGRDDFAFRSAFTVAAAAGEETLHELLVPLPTTVGAGGAFRQIEVTASSPGLPSEQIFDSSNSSTAWPSLAISQQLAQRNLSALNGAVSAAIPGVDTFAVSFDPDHLPADWRGYTGLDALLLSDDEWTALAPGSRLAVLEWVRLGGRLDLYTLGSGPGAVLSRLDLGAPGSAAASVPRGLGSVQAWAWNGQTLPDDTLMKRYGPVPNLAKRLGEDFKSGWALLQRFGTKDSNPLFVILLLMAFGVVVGPVNLFVLAKPGQRHRLFVTTPLISLVASLLILMLILLSDGVGGQGRRVVLANLEPGAAEKRLYVTQEQISRTGVLLGSAFDIADPVLLSPVAIPPSEWNRMTLSTSGPLASYSQAGQVFRGDWFQSRSEQGHFLQSVKPTRSRIELQSSSADGRQPPVLFSSLDFPVGPLYYRDDWGLVWKSAADGPVSGGEPIPLTPAGPEELESWWAEQIGSLSPGTRSRAAGWWKRNGHFFARSTDPRAGFVDTLEAIRWQEDLALIHGPVLPAEAAPVAPASPPRP